MQRVKKYAVLSIGIVIFLFLLFGCARLFTQTPVADFTASPASGYEPLTVTFDASDSYDPDGGIVNYRWNFGDNHTGAGKHTTHTYASFGIYTAKLTVHDNTGTTDSSSQTVTVLNASPRASFIYSPNPVQACSAVTLDGSASFAPNKYLTTYNWHITDSTLGYEVSLSGAIVYWTPCWKGNYTVGLIVVDTDGVSDTAYKTISVEALPPEYVHPGDILYHPAYYSQIAAAGQTKPEGGIVSTITGHIGTVDCNFHVIEAEPGGVTDAYTIDGFVNRYLNAIVSKVVVLRVTGVPVYVRKKAMDFARQQIGKPYDSDSISPLVYSKQMFGPSYYCSELVWAAYEVGSGAYMASDGTVYCGYVNLDAGDGNECTLRCVTPNEIYDNGWTCLVGYLFPR